MATRSWARVIGRIVLRIRRESSKARLRAR
jgi:hypothetical protein